MRPAGKGQHAGTVSPDARVASFSAEIIAAKKPFAVASGAGKPIGEVTPEAVINLLAGLDNRGAPA